jgi:quinol monooxygenase YgiN
MGAIRAVISFTAPSAEAAEAEMAARIERCKQTEAEEAGCLQFEVYRSAVHPEKFVLLEHWESEEAFDRHWRLNRSGTKPPNPSTPGRTQTAEFYKRRVFAQVEGVWSAAEPADRTAGIRFY